MPTTCLLFYKNLLFFVETVVFLKLSIFVSFNSVKMCLEKFLFLAYAKRWTLKLKLILKLISTLVFPVE